MVKQLTREIIIEKLLSIIDLPVIDNFIVVDEKNDIEYRELLENSNLASIDENHNTLSFSQNSSKYKFPHNSQHFLSILNQIFDISKCDK